MCDLFASAALARAETAAGGSFSPELPAGLGLVVNGLLQRVVGPRVSRYLPFTVEGEKNRLLFLLRVDST